MTSTWSAFGTAFACVRKIVRTVGIAIRTRMSAGATVHAISSAVLPWTCFGSGESGRRR